MQKEQIEGFRLSPQQKHLWLLQQKEHRQSYGVQGAILIEGDLNVEVLKKALQNIVEQYEIFRTTFRCVPGMTIPLQVIVDTCELSVCEQNLNTLSVQEQEARIESLFDRGRQQHFNVEDKPPLHLSLFTLSPEKYILLISLSALIADSITLKKLTREISRSYSASLQGKELSDELMQYADIAEWQNELLEQEGQVLGKEYWRNQNITHVSNTNLFGKNQNHEGLEFKAELISVNVNNDLLNKIESLARKYEIATSEFLLSCWQVLLWRITRQQNLIVGIASDGRKHEELTQALGLLSKYLPLPCYLEDELLFKELLRQVSQSVNDAYEWQEYFTWEEIVGVNDNSLPSTLCPFYFEFAQGSEKFCEVGISFSLYKQYTCIDRFKIKLVCLQQIDSLTTEFHYDSGLYDPEDIKNLSKQFLILLESAVKNPEAAIGRLEFLSDRQLQQLLVEFNQTQTNYPQDQCIHHLFEAQVKKTPNSVAVVFEEKQLTYAELNERANQLAHYLQKLGVGAEVLVGIYLERSLEIIIALLGILKAGGAYLPLDTALPAEGLAFRLHDARASILLTQQALIETLPHLATQMVCLDRDGEIIERESRANPTSKVTSNNLVYALFTSGSTGKPKGVVIEHRQLLNYLYAILDQLNLPTGASFATVSTFASDLGNTVIFPSLCTGGCLHVVSQERASDPEGLADYFHRHPIDCLKIVPSHLAALLANSPSGSILPGQCLVLGGEAASWNLIEQIQQQNPDCQILNHYGPTETTVGVTTFAVKGKPACDDSPTVPLGRPLANTQVYVLDKWLQPVPIGVPGELYIGGRGLAREYLNRPELTAERFITNPFARETKLYKTGDLARYLPDGTLEFLGRTDYQVKIRGFRIELGEIEALLSQHPSVLQVVLSVWEKKLGNKRLVAYIVPNKKQPLSVSDLRSFLTQKLPEYMIPSEFVMLKALPLTPNGKVDRLNLPVPEPTRSGVEDVYVAPRTSVEKQLAKIWANVLSIDRVGVRDNFFELGGHSLLLTQLLVRVRDTFQVDFSLNTLLEFPTVAGLAEKIEAVRGKEPSTQSSSSTFLNFNAEAVLDSTIRPDGVTIHAPVTGTSILLTGATGFLGAFLLYELLQQTSADIYCLVREEKLSAPAQSPKVELGKPKLQSILESYSFWHESFSNRIIPIIGDLSQPLLGLAEEQFRSLAERIDAIYHNGAWVHHALPYSTLKTTNVLGTQEILRLACQIKLKPVHFISTINVFSSTHHSGVTLVREEDNLDDSQIAANGYVQSKWVAEKLVTIARDRGLPVCIYRPGRISGHSKTGVFNANDFLHRLIIGCIQLGSAPAQKTSFNIAPVDYVSRAIVYLSRQKESLGKAFHLVNPHPLDSGLLINLIRSLGYPIRQVSYDRWQTELLNIAKHSPDHALYPLLPFFPARESEVEASDSGKLIFDDHNTRNALTDTSIVCPPINRDLLHTYFSYLISSGSLHPPMLT
jgi:amino acid adenylation domain-containing protein/thioester reductase-like protein